MRSFIKLRSVAPLEGMLFKYAICNRNNYAEVASFIFTTFSGQCLLRFGSKCSSPRLIQNLE